MIHHSWHPDILFLRWTRHQWVGVEVGRSQQFWPESKWKSIRCFQLGGETTGRWRLGAHSGVGCVRMGHWDMWGCDCDNREKRTLHERTREINRCSICTYIHSAWFLITHISLLYFNSWVMRGDVYLAKINTPLSYLPWCVMFTYFCGLHALSRMVSETWVSESSP